MSSLWTPSGEHPVDRPGASGRTGAPGPSGQGEPQAPPAGTPGFDESELTAEEREQLEALSHQAEEVRRQLLSAPAGPVVGQQSLQFYELAALHLSQPQPKLDDARVAIDAFAAVVQTLGPRLGDAEAPLRQALNQLQIAYVEAQRKHGGGEAQPNGG